MIIVKAKTIQGLPLCEAEDGTPCYYTRSPTCPECSYKDCINGYVFIPKDDNETPA